MGKYVIDPVGKIEEEGQRDIYLLSGMTLKLARGETFIEGPCEFDPSGKFYIFPGEGQLGVIVNIGEEVEVISEQRDMEELERRKYDVFHRQLGWREQRGEESTRSFDPSNEGW